MTFEYLERYLLTGKNYNGDSKEDIGISDDDIAIVRLQEDIESGKLAIIAIYGKRER